MDESKLEKYLEIVAKRTHKLFPPFKFKHLYKDYPEWLKDQKNLHSGAAKRKKRTKAAIDQKTQAAIAFKIERDQKFQHPISYSIVGRPKKDIFGDDVPPLILRKPKSPIQKISPKVKKTVANVTQALNEGDQLQENQASNIHSNEYTDDTLFWKDEPINPWTYPPDQISCNPLQTQHTFHHDTKTASSNVDTAEEQIDIEDSIYIHSPQKNRSNSGAAKRKKRIKAAIDQKTQAAIAFKIERDQKFQHPISYSIVGRPKMDIFGDELAAPSLKKDKPKAVTKHSDLLMFSPAHKKKLGPNERNSASNPKIQPIPFQKRLQNTNLIAAFKYETEENIIALLEQIDADRLCKSLASLYKESKANIEVEYCGLAIAAYSLSHGRFNQLLQKYATASSYAKKFEMQNNINQRQLSFILMFLGSHQSPQNIEYFILLFGLEQVNAITKKLYQITDNFFSDSALRAYAYKLHAHTKSNDVRSYARNFIDSVFGNNIDRYIFNQEYKGVVAVSNYILTPKEIEFMNMFNTDGICTRTYQSLEHFENDMKHLQNLSVRLKLRNPVKTYGWKYHSAASNKTRSENIESIHYSHGVLIPYSKPAENKKESPQYQQSTKLCFVLHSPFGFTPCYRSHSDEKDPVVAVAFNLKKINPVIMFKHVATSYERPWIAATKEEAIKMANRMQTDTCHSLADFKHHVDNNPFHANELIGTTTQDAIEGIVIGRDNESSRKLARDILQSKYAFFNKDNKTPIVLCNFHKRTRQIFRLK